MTTICTGWKHAIIGDPRDWAANYKRELLDSLVRAGIRRESELRNGLARLKARKRDFLPNPGTFAELCFSAEDLGIPDSDVAYCMARDWSRLPPAERHPAVLAALRQLDSWQWRRLPEEQARPRFQRTWDKIVDRVRAEGTAWLPALPPALAYQPPGVPAARATAHEELRRIREMLG